MSRPRMRGGTVAAMQQRPTTKRDRGDRWGPRAQDTLEALIQTLGSTRDLEQVLRSAVPLVIEATGADACFLHRWHPKRGHLVLAAASAPYDAAVGEVTLSLGEGISGWVAAHREPAVIVDDKRDDPRYKYIPVLEGDKYTSMASVPIFGRGGDLLGVANVHTIARRQFTSEDVHYLELVASLVGGAIENAELFKRLEDNESALEDLVRTTIQAQEEERRRVATEIHDGVTQHLVSIWYRIHACERLLRKDPSAAASELAATKELIDEALDEARGAILDLRPATLDDLGLAPSLEALAARAFRDEDVNAIVDATPMELPSHVEVALYRIAQEAVNNVKRHAGARTVRLSLSEVDGEVELEIADDGVGFDMDDVRRDTSFGLTGITERVRLLGGVLTVESDAGTTLRLRVPAARPATSEDPRP